MLRAGEFWTYCPLVEYEEWMASVSEVLTPPLATYVYSCPSTMRVRYGLPFIKHFLTPYPSCHSIRARAPSLQFR